MSLQKIVFFFVIAFMLFSCKQDCPKVDEQSLNAYLPSIFDLYRLDMAIYESSVNARKWIFEGKVENHPDKERLKEIHKTEFPAIRKLLQADKLSWPSEEQLLYDNISVELDSLIKNQEIIMKQLDNFEKYQDPKVYFEIVPLGDKVRKSATICQENLNKLIELHKAKLLKSIEK